MFKNIGIVVCTIVFLGSGYELAALLLPGVPTLSRLTQGLRDSGHRGTVFMISILCGLVLMILAQWLYYHFNYQVRSNN